MKLDTDNAVHEALAEFDPGDRDAIAEYFRAHDVSPSGIIHLGTLYAWGAASEVEKGKSSPAIALIALFCGGVAFGLHLIEPDPEVIDALLERESEQMGRKATLVTATILEKLVLAIVDLDPLETRGRVMHERRVLLRDIDDTRPPGWRVDYSGIIGVRWEE